MKNQEEKKTTQNLPISDLPVTVVPWLFAGLLAVVTWGRRGFPHHHCLPPYLGGLELKNPKKKEKHPQPTNLSVLLLWSRQRQTARMMMTISMERRRMMARMTEGRWEAAREVIEERQPLRKKELYVVGTKTHWVCSGTSLKRWKLVRSDFFLYLLQPPRGCKDMYLF